MPSSKRTWLITGASSGLGLAIALRALRKGHNVIGTARNPSTASSNHPEFEKLGGQWLRLDVSLTSAEQVIRDAITAEEKRQSNTIIEWTILSNAGYGLQGVVEDMSESQIQAHLNTVFFGSIRVLKATIPTLRRNKCGSMLFMSSILGFVPMVEAQMYSAAKFAVEAIYESYASLLAPFGIKCIILEPGQFRSGLAGSSITSDGGVTQDYKERLDQWLGFVEAARDDQSIIKGDPGKLATIVVEVVEGESKKQAYIDEVTSQGKPLRLLLGKDCYDAWGARLGDLTSTYDKMQETALSTDFDE